MQVLCPSCDTGYEIETILRPRRLRCARCGTEWRELPPDMAAAANPEPVQPTMPAAMPMEPAPPDPPRLEPEQREELSVRPARRPPAWAALPRLPRRGDALLLGLWVLSLAVMAFALFAFWHWRSVIGHRWPPSLRLYRLLPRPPG